MAYLGQQNQQTIHPSLYKRKILHVDMDAFYASVEIRANPTLSDKPIVVGGSPDSRGVVCTANYIARKFGIRSAMACSQAYKLCPEAIFLPPRFSLYKQASSDVFAIFARYCDLIEGMSLDEAYLDVTKASEGTTATKIAFAIKEAIQQETQLTASVGVAPNKMLAKIASDINKPNGLAVILPEQAFQFVQGLSVRKIPGIGPVTAKQLADLGITTCADVPRHVEMLRLKHPGLAPWLEERSAGIDDRDLEIDAVRQSIGSEETFAVDIDSTTELLAQLHNLTLDLYERMERAQAMAKCFTVKIKYADFRVQTLSLSLAVYTKDRALIRDTLLHLLEKGRDPNAKVRLLGVSASRLLFANEAEGISYQPSLAFE